MDKRNFLKKVAVAGIILGSTLSYPFLIEPNMILKSEVSVKINNIKDCITIVHITDLHLKEFSLREKEAIKRINSIKKDLTVITGDFIENRDGIKYLKMFLSELENNKPVYAVLGNWDYWSNSLNELINVLENYKIKLLVNENIKETVGSSELYIVGVDDPYTGNHDIQKALNNIEREKPIILLAHSPQIIDEAVSNKISLVLAGHTHGGQVSIPLIGSPFIPLPEKYRKYVSGLYKVGDTIMYVNRGIGTSIANIRFLCPPEVAVIKICE
ncbi:MAG: metallophosphoesterase [Nitrososphaeria archaeon]|nr:metallophosphoesterase [Nitrososphaeria archaeon]